MSINYNFVLLIGIISIVIIVYLLKDKLKTLAIIVGKSLNLIIDTHTQKPTESADLIASIERHEKQNDEENEALKTLKWIQEEIQGINGSYIYSESALKNKEIATLMYTRCNKRLVGTAFFENPNDYKDDLAGFVRPGTEYIRITTSDICPPESQQEQREILKSFQSNARLTVIPASIEISKLGGLFCEMKDGSHLVFIALNNAGNKSENQGIAFCGDTAKYLFQYYESWACL